MMKLMPDDWWSGKVGKYYWHNLWVYMVFAFVIGLPIGALIQIIREAF